MRRIVSTIAPALALVVSSVPAVALAGSSHGHQQARPSAGRSAAHPARHRAAHSAARRGTALDMASTALGAQYVHVSWNWIKAASGYRIQIARHQDFGKVVASRKKANSRHRPAGGREAAVVGKLHDATYYWVRVRKVKGHHKSHWASPVRVATKAHTPDRISDGRGHRGPHAGQTTLRWKGSGKFTDYYRITTALTPFGTPQHRGDGRHTMTFTVPGNRHSVTLTAQQTAQAGAGIGSGHFLFFRITAVRNGEADTATRPYPFLLHTGVTGEHSTGNGTKLRIVQYNMHVASKDLPGHPWKHRQHLIAKNIAKARPAVASIQELMPSMWTDYNGGIGLHASLRKAGVGRYRLTRTTAYWKDAGQDTKILYDPKKVTMVSNCPEDVPSCYIMLPDSKKHVAAWAKFRDNASGQEFYFVSAHLTTKDDAKTDALRGQQAQAINDGIRAIDTQGLPVIFGSDANSSQVSIGSDAPHQVLQDAGWYNTLSAARVVNGQYNSVNHYELPEKASPWGFGSMYDTIETLNMPGADLWKQVITRAPWPSDHNMIFTDVRLP
jgi:hypothetical protein